MARTGRPKAELTLSDVERQTLQRWARRAKTAQALASRARIVLACADGMANKDVAVSVGVSEATVGKWRRQFVAKGLAGLDDADRPGRPRTIRDEQVEQVVVDTLEATPPDGGTHWSTRLMATRTGMTQTAVSRIWRAFGLKPHKVNYWKLSTDPNFIDKLYDVVGLYLNPPERAIVLCADEKSNIQALDRSAPVLPMMPADPTRQTHDYIRHGTSSLFAALDVATGKVITRMHRRHRAVEFKKFLNQINREVPADLAVHLILDNYATHKTPEIKAWLLRHPRFHLHFIPTSSSWLNLVERWFGEVTTRKIRRGTHRSVAELEADIHDWIEHWNTNPRPFIWVKTAEQILESIAAYCQRLMMPINNSAHYRLPSTGELVPLLQIVPSKTDSERLLLVDPELADVLSAIVCRIRAPNGAVPLLAAYDYSEKIWMPPMGLLFQRTVGGERHAFHPRAIYQTFNRTLSASGLTDTTGRPLVFRPHDFRRHIFVTDAIRSGLPPHIAAKICGHATVDTTMGYAAIYPEDVIAHHRAFIARRRAERPSEEYRDLTNQEWDAFLAHFELRKVALGTCGRDHGTPCQHENACVRCPLLRVDPAQMPRLEGIHTNLIDRLREAKEQGWLGEVAAIETTIAAASQKLEAMRASATQHSTTNLGMPRFHLTAGRLSSET